MEMGSGLLVEQKTGLVSGAGAVIEYSGAE